MQESVPRPQLRLLFALARIVPSGYGALSFALPGRLVPSRFPLNVQLQCAKSRTVIASPAERPALRVNPVEVLPVVADSCPSTVTRYEANDGEKVNPVPPETARSATPVKSMSNPASFGKVAGHASVTNA